MRPTEARRVSSFAAASKHEAPPWRSRLIGTDGLYSKSPFHDQWCYCNLGGNWGARLKFAGYDLVIVQGKSAEPVFLHIDDDEATLLPADHLWGRTVWVGSSGSRAASQHAG